jgi:hypothetical protein
MSNLIIWDIETVPDLKGFAAANGHDGRTDDEIRAAMGDKFPKHVYHSIICIGALVAQREDGPWKVIALVCSLRKNIARPRRWLCTHCC